MSFAFETQGNYGTFKYIVNKYGFIPKSCMKSSEIEFSDLEFKWLFNNKIIEDIKKIIAAKNKKDRTKIYALKEEMLKENYDILCKVFGTPPDKFLYKYEDNNGKKVCIKTTPLDFKNKYLTLNLDDFIILENYPSSNRKYNKKYNYKGCKNVYYGVNHDFVTMKIDLIKESIIKQLRDGIPVYCMVYSNKMRDWKNGVIDLNLYNLDELNIKILDKKTLIDLNQIRFMHAMSLKGVKSEEKNPVYWKFENSYGTKDANGFITFSDKAFDLFVLSAVINKKYISNNVIKIYDSKKSKTIL